MKLKMNLLGQWIGAVAIAAVMPLAHANYTFSNGGFEGASDGSPWVFGDPNAPSTTALKVVPGGRTSKNALQFKSDKKTSLFSGTAQQAFSIDANKAVGTFADNSGFYLFEFWTKADPLASFSVTLQDAVANEYTGPDPFMLGQADGWTSYSAVVGSLDADFTLEFTFGAPSRSTGPVTFLLDDVSFTACPSLSSSANCLGPQPPVDMPEPGSLFLVGAALAGLAAVRRKVRV
jgi:hypothetical protein